MNHFFFISFCIGIGAVSGFLGGLLGIGGGVVIVPALIILLDVMAFLPAEEVTAVAVATSLACVLFTSLSAAITQMRAGMVDWVIVQRWAPFLIVGSYLAGWIATALPLMAFRGFIGVFLLLSPLSCSPVGNQGHITGPRGACPARCWASAVG